MNMNNNEFNSFLFSHIRKAMDHLRIQKPRLYAIRYWKIHEVFHIRSFYRERETCLVLQWERSEKKGCLVRRKMSTEAFGMNEVEKEMEGFCLNEFSIYRFEVPRGGGLIRAFFSFSFLFLFQIPPPYL